MRVKFNLSVVNRGVITGVFSVFPANFRGGEFRLAAGEITDVLLLLMLILGISFEITSDF